MRKFFAFLYALIVAGIAAGGIVFAFGASRNGSNGWAFVYLVMSLLVSTVGYAFAIQIIEKKGTSGK